MATHTWGGAVNNTNLFTFTNGVGLYTAGIGFPLGNLTRAGTRPVQVSSVTPAYVNNTGGSYVYAGSPRQTSGFHANSGGTFTFYVLKTGGAQAFFGRNTSGSPNSRWTDDDSLVTGPLPGSMVWLTGPTAPRTVTAESTGASVVVNWVAPASTGDSAITGYRVEYSNDNWATSGFEEVGNVLTASLTGLQNGTTYEIRVYARNAVTTTAGTMSVASNTATVFAGYWTFSGDSSYAVEITNGGSASDPIDFTVQHAIDVSDVEANTLMSASVVMHLSAAVQRPLFDPMRIDPSVDWLDSNGSVVSTITLAPVQFRDQDRVIAFRGMPKPSEAVTALFKFYAPQFIAPLSRNIFTGDVIYFDGFLLINGVLQPFFDGNTVGASWLGTPDNSRSEMPNPNPTNVLYSAFEDGNRIFSTPEGETTVTTLVTTSYPLEIDVLEPTDTLPAPNGTYYVSDTNGDPIPASDWTAAGGVVSASPGDRPGTIVVTIIGPSNIPGFEGPFYLASGDSSDRIAQFTVTGTGVVTNPTELQLSTGADPETVTTEIAREIDIPFIDTREQAYERGVWSAITASRPFPTLSATVPLHRLGGFGLTSGSLVRYYESIYRIRDVQMGVSSAVISADWYVLTSEFEELWADRETLEFENLWNPYDSGDFFVAPLKDNRIE